MNIEEALFNLDECFEFLEYWLKSDENLRLEKIKGNIENTNEENEDKSEDVKQVIMETIEKYEKMKRESINELEIQVLQTTIDTLRSRLQEIENKKEQTIEQEIQNEGLKQKKEERRKNALKEIFEFYCVQQLNVGRSSTFDRLGRLLNTINIGTFTVFLKNFRLKIDHLVNCKIFFPLIFVIEISRIV